MNKGWHGGNRIKSKKATEEAGFCYLCGSEDSQAHWLHHCTDISLSEARKAAKLEIQNYSRELIPSAISSALLSVLNSTDEPERIWTANWSSSQIQHLEGILQTHQAIPSTPAGWHTLQDTLLQLSRILSRTALHMWTCKAILETPHRQKYRQSLINQKPTKISLNVKMETACHWVCQSCQLLLPISAPTLSLDSESSIYQADQSLRTDSSHTSFRPI